jgi:hypothetical protein
MTGWRKVRVIVEIPVRGNFSERDLTRVEKGMMSGPLSFSTKDRCQPRPTCCQRIQPSSTP